MIRQETYLRTLGILFVCSSFVFFILLDMHRHIKSTSTDGVQKNDIFLEEMKQKIETAKSHLLAFKDLFANVKKELQTFHFDTSSSIELETSLKDGISLPFGYASFGPPAQGFSGFNAKLQLTFIPHSWESIVLKAFSDIGLGDLMTITPAQEWLLKFLLLIKDRVQKVVSLGEMAIDSTILLARLFFTPGLDSLSKVLDSISPSLKSILSTVKLNNEKENGIAFLDTYYSLVHQALGRQFPKKMISGKLVDNTLYVPNGSKINDAQARWVLFSLFVRVFLFYAELRYLYEKTDAGKKASHAISSAPSLKERLAAITSYNNALPGFDSVKTFLIIESARLLNRLENASYKKALISIFDPVLQLFGLSLDGFLTMIDGTSPAPEPPVPSLSEKELAALSLDDFDATSF